MYDRNFTIDPGANGTGWAMWDENWLLLSNGVVTSKIEDWQTRCVDITNELYAITRGKAKNMYFEFPEFHQSPGGAVTAQSGALVKLAWFVGYLTGQLDYHKFHLITPTQWKGQLPKQVVIDRIKKKLPNVKAKSHDWDAIGLGLYLRGDFK